MADNTEFITYQIQVDTKSGQINIDGVTKKFEQADRAFNKLKKDIGKGLPTLNKQLDTTSKAAGGATASVMEMGRVISDAPYGIRGVANNLTQLVSQMGFTVKSAGSLKLAMKEMWAAMMGPLGIVLAITAVISAMDLFYGGAKKAEGAATDFKDSLKELERALSTLYTTQEDVNGKIKDYVELSELRIKTDKAIKDSSDELIKINKEIAEAERLVEVGRVTGFKGNQKRIENLEILEAKRLAIYEKATKAIKERKKAEDKFNSAAEGTVKALESQKSALEKEQKTLSDSSKKWKEYQITIDEIQKAIDLITGGNKKKSKTVKPSIFKTPEELELEAKSQLDAVRAVQKRIDLQNLSNEHNVLIKAAETEEEKKKLRLKYEKEKLEITLRYEKEALLSNETKEKESNAKRYDNYVKSLDKKQQAFVKKTNENEKLDKDTRAKLIADSVKETEDARTKANLKLIENNKKVEEAYVPLKAKFEELAKSRRDAIGAGSEESQQSEFDALSHYISAYKSLMSGITTFLQGESDRQLTIEQNKTNSLNEELNNRLLNEDLSKQERKNIQNQIAQNDEELRKKQNKIAEKAFNTAKAFNIIMATVDTYAAANKALNDPTPMPTFARWALAGATIVSGLAQVAAIARSKFQPTAANTPINTGAGRGGSGGNGREFNFNLAGSSNRNQIAEAIGSRFDQPLRAYVVSRDITTQQQIDADIRSNASF